MKLTLPLPPSTNRYWRNYRGRVVVSQEAKDYKQDVGLLLNLQGYATFAGDVAITVNVYRDQKRGDLDNFLKVLLDALNGRLYADDKQIKRIEASLHDAPGHGRVEVEVEEGNNAN